MLLALLSLLLFSCSCVGFEETLKSLTAVASLLPCLEVAVNIVDTVRGDSLSSLIARETLTFLMDFIF